MTKIVFSDFDETMLNYYSDKNYFDEYQIHVLKKLKEKGIYFCIVTGRNVSFFEQFPMILPYVSYIIASNGSCIYDVKNKKIIYHDVIGVQEVSYFVDYAKENNYSLVFNCFGEQFYNEKKVDIHFCEQLVLFVPNKLLEMVIEDISKIMSVSFNNISSHDDRYAIDINNKDVSKGNGIKILCDYLDINIEDTLCFGDSDNDVSMFQVVGKSVSVGNAKDKIKSLANDISLPSDQNGIFKYIDCYILNQK